jgi:hypothetical protein
MMLDVLPMVSPHAHSTTAFHLSAEDRIASLERELFNLRRAKLPFQPMVKTWRQHAQEDSQGVDTTEDARPAITHAPPPVRQNSLPHRPPTPSPAASFAPALAVQGPPIHPYSHIRNATLPAPAQVTSVPVTPKNTPTGQKPDAIYRHAPPVYEKKHATDVFEQAMEAPITLTHRQLYSIAPKVRAQTRELLTVHRVTSYVDVSKTRQVQFLDADEDTAEEVSVHHDNSKSAKIDKRTAQFYQDMPQPFVQAATLRKDTESEPLIVPDPYESYLRKFPPGHPPDHLQVTKESSSLRSIVPYVNHFLRVKCIVDPGCQIIAMSEDICHALGLIYSMTRL